jgi:hypothetical protein
MRTDAERDRASLQRRLEVLKLPVAPLQRHGFVMPLHPATKMREPEAVGVGPDGTALAVWQYREGVNRKQVTWHVGGRRRVVGAVDVETELRVSFVQPLPRSASCSRPRGPELAPPTPKYGPATAIWSIAATSVTPSKNS